MATIGDRDNLTTRRDLPADASAVQSCEVLDDLTKDNIKLLHRFTKIGTALSGERNIERLLEMILEEAKELANADGGTLYIMSDDKTELQFAIVQTSSLKIKMGGKGEKITWKPIPLRDADGSPNHHHVCAHAALTKTTVNIEDVYQQEGFDFQGTRNFDRHTGYRSRSMLVVPMKDHEDEVIGVLQLLNAMEGGSVSSFSPVSLEITESFASQAAVALSNKRLIKELQDLLESFIRAIAVAIDEKSPYTGGHVRRVAELTMQIAGKINAAKEGHFAEIELSEDELKELQTAAWLHDVGKITTPEHIIDKETKLQTIVDRIEIVKLRIELYKTKFNLHKLETLIGEPENKAILNSGYYPEQDEMEKKLRDEFSFLMKTNEGGEFMSDEMIARLRQIGMTTFPMDGKAQPLLSPEEVENLSIRRGTLTLKEREIIQNHAAMTNNILLQLPFPEKMKHVPHYASSHHETLNGRGYPRGLTAEELPLQARIIALADIFEALTASDRPYKKGNTLSETMGIMEKMAKELHIDPDIFELFKKEGLHEEYALRELGPVHK
ncbi:MAG: GAF domain-containing protein [Syntrophales bacterium]|jgi:HD-GYP domain-containing protein (c-di-GMP phosphodiesterase class II)|nr:GAF domain-containing protein [Syntrophales bacterium]